MSFRSFSSTNEPPPSRNIDEDVPEQMRHLAFEIHV